jgi:hypothetical protein
VQHVLANPEDLCLSSRAMQEMIQMLIVSYEAVELLKVIYKCAEIAKCIQTKLPIEYL